MLTKSSAQQVLISGSYDDFRKVADLSPDDPALGEVRRKVKNAERSGYVRENGLFTAWVSDRAYAEIERAGLVETTPPQRVSLEAVRDFELKVHSDTLPLHGDVEREVVVDCKLQFTVRNLTEAKKMLEDLGIGFGGCEMEDAGIDGILLASEVPGSIAVEVVQ